MSTTDERGWIELEERAQQNEREVWAGLDDARATLAEIWRRTCDDDARARAMRALKAVIEAEATMRAADAYRRGERGARRRLEVACCLRVGPSPGRAGRSRG